MVYFKLSFKYFLLLCIVLLINSCDLLKKDNPVGPESKFETGDNIDLGTQAIGTNGGILKFEKPGDSLNGLTVNIDDSSFNESRTFKISYSTIKKHNFNQYFQPISPLITISNGGGYANKIIEVKIPVKIPAGEFPLAFYYDEANGKLEPIPILLYDSSSVTIGTRHFQTSNLFPVTGLKLVSKIQSDDSYSKLVISSLKESVINLTPIISSGFKPGIDDWEFVNYGSYLSPGGHCAGQSMTSMWYYFEKKESSGNLFNKYNDNSKIWQDNSRGYRFSSVIQKDIDWDGTYYKLQNNYIDKNQSLDRMKWFIIAGSMLVTSEPQFIAIWRIKTDKDGKDIVDNKGNPVYGGHAIICYQISVTNGQLFIDDPNKPGLPQSIEYKNDRFSPYVAKQNASASSHPYPFITYYAKTALIDWIQIGSRYSELLDGTIGLKSPNTFPAYTIWVNDGAGYELKDGFKTDLDSLSLTVFCPTAEVSFTKDGKKAIGFSIFDEAGTLIGGHSDNGAGFIKLKPGLNKLGIYIIGWRNSSTDNNGNYIDKFIDFKWFNVTLLSIETYPGTNITQTTATGGGNIASDGGFPITARGVCWGTTANPTIANSHTSDGSGTGTFVSNLTGLTPNTPYYVRAYATNSKGTMYGNEVTFITTGNTTDERLKVLQATKFIDVNVTGEQTHAPIAYEIRAIGVSRIPIKWSGMNFSHDANSSNYHEGDNINGSISADFKTVEVVAGNVIQGDNHKTTTNIRCQNIPNFKIRNKNPGSELVEFYISTTDLTNTNYTNYLISMTYVQDYGGGKTNYYVSTDWDNNTNVNDEISVEFTAQ